MNSAYVIRECRGVLFENETNLVFCSQSQTLQTSKIKYCVENGHNKMSSISSTAHAHIDNYPSEYNTLALRHWLPTGTVFKHSIHVNYSMFKFTSTYALHSEHKIVLWCRFWKVDANKVTTKINQQTVQSMQLTHWSHRTLHTEMSQKVFIPKTKPIHKPNQ